MDEGPTRGKHGRLREAPTLRLSREFFAIDCLPERRVASITPEARPAVRCERTEISLQHFERDPAAPFAAGSVRNDLLPCGTDATPLEVGMHTDVVDVQEQSGAESGDAEEGIHQSHRLPAAVRGEARKGEPPPVIRLVAQQPRSLGSRLKAVAATVYRLNMARQVSVIADLAPQAQDMVVDRFLIARVVASPGCSEQLRAAENPLRVAHEPEQQPKLEAREHDFTAVHFATLALRVEPDTPRSEQCGAGCVNVAGAVACIDFPGGTGLATISGAKGRRLGHPWRSLRARRGLCRPRRKSGWSRCRRR